MHVCCECCVLSGRGLCDGLITRPEESYWMWRDIVCDQERNLKLEEAKACYRAVKNTATMGCNTRKTNKQTTLTWLQTKLKNVTFVASAVTWSKGKGRLWKNVKNVWLVISTVSKSLLQFIFPKFIIVLTCLYVKESEEISSVRIWTYNSRQADRHCYYLSCKMTAPNFNANTCLNLTTPN
jgi:hypothetical protein